MTNGEWFMTTTTQPLEVKRNGTCVWLCFDNEDANHYALPTKWWDEERVDTSEDLIRQSDAIKAIEAEECLGYVECQSEWLYDRINAIPSADRPQGAWIEMGQNEDGTHNVKCNQCDSAYKMRGHAKSISTKLKYRFCPNCGARMKGADGKERVMTNLEWLKTLSAEELADWFYDEWLHHLQYRWSSSRGGLIIWLKDRKTEPTGYNLSPVDKDINVRSKDEPQNIELSKVKSELNEWRDIIGDDVVDDIISNLEEKADEDEPQTERNK